MEKSRTVGEAAVENQPSSDRAAGDGARGIVHSFVGIVELRRIMSCLTAVEMLQLMLSTSR